MTWRHNVTRHSENTVKTLTSMNYSMLHKIHSANLYFKL